MSDAFITITQEIEGTNTIKINNPKAYKIPNPKMVTLTVEVAMDLIPGWGYEPEDHIQFIFANPYVQSITVEKALVVDPIEENQP